MRLPEVKHILKINEQIRLLANEDSTIPYTGYEDYPIQMSKIEALIENIPKSDILTIATYYLKNLILLQPFADGNHRTALVAVELLFEMNCDKYSQIFEYSVEEAEQFQIDLYRLRFRTYQTYEQHSTDILKDTENAVDSFCRNFIKIHLSKSDEHVQSS